MIDRASLPRLPLFAAIAEAGHIERAEMERTFNCGIGYVLVTAAPQSDELCRFFRRRGVGARVIGEIKAARRGVRYRGKR